MRRILSITFFLCITLLFQTQAPAAEVAGYAVAPFDIKGPNGFNYLQKAIPSMLSSRLYWKGHFEPVSDMSAVPVVADKQSAVKALDTASADYVVWGSVSVNGADAVVNTRVLGRDGRSWQRETKTRVTDLIASLQNVADGINFELFGRPLATSASSAVPSQTVVQPLNPNMVQNQTNASAVYLNPQIRYQGQEGSRLRSQHLQFPSVSMEVGDFDGDGKNDIALLTSDCLYIYKWGENLEKIAEQKFPRSQIALVLRKIDLNRDRVPELVVSSVGIDTTMTTDNDTSSLLFTEPDRPYSYILSFKGGAFTFIAERLPFYMSVASFPPDYMPVLVGQKGDLNSGFARSGVREVLRNGNNFSLGRKLAVPPNANVFSFAWIPAMSPKDKPLLVNMTKKETLQVFAGTNSDSELYAGSDVFGGSPSIIEAPNSMPGMGKDYSLSPLNIPVAGRMLIVDLDKNRQPELLVNKPISVAAQYFSSFRDYPEGEIHALSWDGVGLSLLWKTRRIKGSVVDFALADINNDAKMDLVVCVNTYSGAIGVRKPKTIIVAYPLDLENADPSTPYAADVNS